VKNYWFRSLCFFKLVNLYRYAASRLAVGLYHTALRALPAAVRVWWG
jgi:hypothetical protein